MTATDAGDGLLLPALGDGHAHPLFGGLEGLMAALRGMVRLSDEDGRDPRAPGPGGRPG